MKNNKHPISMEGMQLAFKTFVRCQEELQRRLSYEDSVLIDIWISEVIRINPSVVLRPDSIVAVTEKIFSSDVLSGYVLDLSFWFFASMGPDFAQKLSANLAVALMCDGPYPALSVIPESLKVSMPASLFAVPAPLGLVYSLLCWLGVLESTSVDNFLLNNKFLMVVLLMHLTNTAAE